MKQTYEGDITLLAEERPLCKRRATLQRLRMNRALVGFLAAALLKPQSALIVSSQISVNGDAIPAPLAPLQPPAAADSAGLSSSTSQDAAAPALSVATATEPAATPLPSPPVVSSSSSSRLIPPISLPPSAKKVWLNIGSSAEPPISPDENTWTIAVEPLLSVVAQIPAHPRLIVIPAAISDTVGFQPFYSYNKNGVSSSLSPAMDSNAYWAQADLLKGMQPLSIVPVLTLKHLIDAIPSEITIEYLKTDTQGHDYACLASAGREALARVHFIHHEAYCWYHQSYAGPPNSLQVDIAPLFLEGAYAGLFHPIARWGYWRCTPWGEADWDWVRVKEEAEQVQQLGSGGSGKTDENKKEKEEDAHSAAYSAEGSQVPGWAVWGSDSAPVLATDGKTRLPLAGVNLQPLLPELLLPWQHYQTFLYETRGAEAAAGGSADSSSAVPQGGEAAALEEERKNAALRLRQRNFTQAVHSINVALTAEESSLAQRFVEVQEMFRELPEVVWVSNSSLLSDSRVAYLLQVSGLSI